MIFEVYGGYSHNGRGWYLRAGVAESKDSKLMFLGRQRRLDKAKERCIALMPLFLALCLIKEKEPKQMERQVL